MVTGWRSRGSDPSLQVGNFVFVQRRCFVMQSEADLRMAAGSTLVDVVRARYVLDLTNAQAKLHLFTAKVCAGSMIAQHAVGEFLL